MCKFEENYRRSNLLSIPIVTILFYIFTGLLFSQEIPLKEFYGRRQAVLNLLNDSSAVILKSAGLKIRNGDVAYRYRQESNFLYLSGVNNKNCYLILYPGGINIKGNKILYLLFKPEIENDSISNKNEALLNNSKFQNVFKQLKKRLKIIYTSSPDIQFVYDWFNDRAVFLERDNKKYFENKNPGIQIKNISSIINGLREIKSQNEIAVIQKAINITKDGIEKAFKICKPGKWEYELRSEIEGEMMKHGSSYPGFPSIIGSGKNSLVLHYEDDNCEMKDGDVVVMDVGAEIEGYSADITRTIPVSGKFSEGQEKIYELVLSVQKQAIEMIKPGITIYDLNNKVLEIFAKEGLQSYLPHGVSHSIGLDVHDVVSSDTLKAGMIITLEPGLYFPPDGKDVPVEYRGFGIRIEDDVLVTENGYKVLSAEIPKEISEIENIMNDND